MSKIHMCAKSALRLVRNFWDNFQTARVEKYIHNVGQYTGSRELFIEQDKQI